MSSGNESFIVQNSAIVHKVAVNQLLQAINSLED